MLSIAIDRVETSGVPSKFDVKLQLAGLIGTSSIGRTLAGQNSRDVGNVVLERIAKNAGRGAVNPRQTYLVASPLQPRGVESSNANETRCR
jgi:hypothetical protein